MYKIHFSLHNYNKSCFWSTEKLKSKNYLDKGSIIINKESDYVEYLEYGGKPGLLPGNKYKIKLVGTCDSNTDIKFDVIVKCNNISTKIITDGKINCDIEFNVPDNSKSYKISIKLERKGKVKLDYVELTKYDDEGLSKEIKNKEKEYNGINYFLKREESEHLLIVFSSYNVGIIPNTIYNYICPMKGIKINKLYIMDSFGINGTYYSGIDELGNDIESLYLKLINSVIETLGVSKDNIILAGTSKGGSSALYYGLKYGYKHIYIGAPQIYLNKFFSSLNNVCYESTRDFLKRKHKDLDSIILNLFKGNKYYTDTTIKIICASEDKDHLIDHIIPFLNEAKNNNINNCDCVLEYGKNHSAIGELYPKFLKENIIRLMEVK